MAVEKPLTVRDYLEPRRAAAAGSRSAVAAGRRAASFQEMLKNQRLQTAEVSAAGFNISDYLKSPVMKHQAMRAPRPSGVTIDSAVGPQVTATAVGAGDATRHRLVESDQASKAKGDRRTHRSLQNTSQEIRADTSSGQPVEKSIQQAAAKYNLSPELIRSVIRAESNFQVDAVSPAGAKGLMQLMPETAKELGVTNPFDIHQNIDGGARYLRQMLDRFGGDLKRALAAYNAGPGAVEQHNGEVPYAETRQYVKRVMRSVGLKA
jgi:soluble lytic murein transglycosylase-like protein